VFDAIGCARLGPNLLLDCAFYPDILRADRNV
jgi:hypothetical protein